MKQNIRAVITDLDGTLLTSNAAISEEDKKSLSELKRKNIVIIAATGRSIEAANEILYPGIPIDYLVFTNGIGILNLQNGNIIQEQYIELTQTKQVYEKLLQLKFDFVIADEPKNSHKIAYHQVSETNTDLAALKAKYSKHVIALSPNNIPKHASRIVCFLDTETEAEQIRSAFPEMGIIRATSPINHKTIWMEIYPPGVNKGSAVSYLCNRLGISLEQTAGIGNDYNDIDFLDIVGHAFVVAESPQILQKKYTTLQATNNQNAFSEMIQLFFLEKNFAIS